MKKKEKISKAKMPDTAKAKTKAEKKSRGKEVTRNAPAENTSAGNATQRISWIDNAKALGIIAVFGGHILERIFKIYAIPEAGLQYKLIYSFHMPLFFILSGYIVKESQHRGFLLFMKNKFRTRIAPFFFFNILMLLCSLIIIKISNQSFYDAGELLKRLLYLLAGRATFNTLMWFVACLFTVEVINYLLYPVLKKSKIALGAAMVLFYIIGWGIADKAALINQYITIPDYWCIDKAPVALSFYLFGSLLASYPFFQEKMNPYLNGFLLLITAACVLATFNLNIIQSIPAYVVMVGNCEYGNFFLFPLTALAGSIFIILLSRLIPSFSFMSFLGQNTLSLVGLNYLFVMFANAFFIYYLRKFITNNPDHLSIFSQCAFLTGITLLMCVPFVMLLKKYLPFMIGYKR